MEDSYGDVHRVLLTYIRAVRSVSAETMARKIEILATHYPLDVSDPQRALRELISSINVKIEKFGFKIDVIRDQDTHVIHYAFVNTRFDEFIQGCTSYSAPELDTIKQLIDTVINAHNYVFSVLYAMAKQRVTSVLKQKTSDSVILLQRLVDDGWLEITDLDRVVLSPACLAELRKYLDDKYGYFSAADPLGKLLKCFVCGDTVTLGYKCGQDNCYAAFHKKCLNFYLRDHEACPVEPCGTRILDKRVVGPIVEEGI